MGVFDNAIFYLDSLGLTQVILPFVLIFTVLFALLQKIALFKEGEKGKEEPSRKINSIIALAIALIVVLPHITGGYPADSDPINVINAFLPAAVVITVVLLVLLMLVGFIGGEKEVTKSPLIGIAGIIAIIALALTLWRALYPAGSPSWLYFLDDPELQALVVVFIIMGGAIWYIASEPGKGKPYKDYLKEFFGG
ncbi:MAG: hypothetical protein AABY13_03030 [Nanoarchaeota archaeon]